MSGLMSVLEADEIGEDGISDELRFILNVCYSSAHPASDTYLIA